MFAETHCPVAHHTRRRNRPCREMKLPPGSSRKGSVPPISVAVCTALQVLWVSLCLATLQSCADAGDSAPVPMEQSEFPLASMTEVFQCPIGPDEGECLAMRTRSIADALETVFGASTPFDATPNVLNYTIGVWYEDPDSSPEGVIEGHYVFDGEIGLRLRDLDAMTGVAIGHVEISWRVPGRPLVVPDLSEYWRLSGFMEMLEEGILLGTDPQTADTTSTSGNHQ